MVADDGITDSTRFPASLLDSAFVSRSQWTIHSVSTTLMESIMLSRFQASLLDSALDSLLMIKMISSASTCRDNSWGEVREHPSQSYRLGSRHSCSADDSLKDDDGISYSIPSEPPGLNSRSADDLNSRQSSSVVDCCVELDNDNGFAVAVAADPISNVPKEAVVDPLHGENASSQVKPRSESSRLDYRLSSIVC